MALAQVVLEGLTFHYDAAGEGMALLFVHGHPFDRSMWRPQLDYFSRDGFHTIAPDLRGYGASTVRERKTTLDGFAGDLVGLLDHLDVERAVAVGLSMGGQIVMELYRLFPQRVSALVLADTSAPAETAQGRKFRQDMADRLEHEGMNRYAHEVLPKMVAPRNIEAQPDVARHVLGMMLATPPEGAAAALRGRAERPDYVKMLGQVTVPSLVVVGADDEFTPLKDALLMHERIEGSTLVVIEGAAHMPNLEHPDEFNEALGRFLTQWFARPQT
ncbi:MAG: alpha/beta fold hydrolase [Actinobacteria bacterium]|nr:alpha/beta fold hydrolase [Actinomycetota bacterium]